MKKTCTKCKRELDVGAFSARRDRPDGLFYQCKDCCRLYRAAHKKETAVYQQRYYAEHRPQNAATARRYRARHPEDHQASVANWLSNHPGAKAAHNAVTHAVEDGRMTKPAVCSLCLAIPEPRCLHFHHPDHAAVFVGSWVCAKCHKATHRAEGRAA